MPSTPEEIELGERVALVPTDEDKPKLADVKPLSMFEYLQFADRLDVFLMITGLIGAIAHGAALPSFSFIFGDILNSLGSPDASLDAVATAALRITWIGIGAFIAAFAQVSFWKISAVRQTSRIRKMYLKALLDRDIAWFDTGNIAEISATMDSDCKLIMDGMSEKVSNLVQFLTMFLTGLGLGFSQSWQLTLVILSTTPLILVAAGMFGYVLSQAATRGQKAYGEAGAHAQEVFTGIRTVAAFQAEEREISKYNKMVEQAMQVGFVKGRLAGTVIGVVFMIMFFSYGLSFWYGAKLIADGATNPTKNKPYQGGDIITVFFSVLVGSFALGQAGPNVPPIIQGRVAAAKVYKIIKEHINFVKKSSGEKLESVKGDIEFKDIEFTYPARRDVKIFDKLSFKIEAGKTVAFVGESGSGKSSIVSLIEKFYDPSGGEISLDGMNLQSLDTQWLRYQIGLVSQEPVLFQGTIAENIKFGKPNASDEEVIEAAKAANAHDFISKFPNGYGTRIGGNESLSGGQKQRIAIARAMMKKPSILLLDEATSALDNESEAIVQRALDSLMKGRTTLIIAHRLSTIRNADKIFLLKNGKIIEQGSHQELIDMDGYYRTLIQAQMQSDSKEEVPIEKKPSETRKPSNTANAASDVTLVEKKESKEEDILKKKASKIPLSRLYPLIKPDIWYLIVGTLAAGCNGIVFPSFSLLLSEFITVFFLPDKQQIRDESIQVMIYFFVLAVFMFLVNFAQASFFSIVGERLTKNLRTMLFSTMIRMEIGWFDLPENRVGILTSRLSSDAEKVRAISVDRLSQIIQGAFMISFGVGIAFYFGWPLALVILAISPLIAVAGIMQAQFMGARKGGVDAFEKANNIATESLLNIRTVKSLTREAAVSELFATELLQPDKTEFKKGLGFGLGSGSTALIMFGLYGFCFYIGSIFVKRGWMEFGDVLRAFFGIVMSFMQLGELTQFSADAKDADLSLNAIFAMLAVKSKIDPLDSESGSKAEIKGLPIKFEEVEFRYPMRPEAPVFRNLTLNIEPGRTYALVGPSGGGKSSVIVLLQRFYDIERGKITIGESRLSEINVSHLRRHLGIVSQEPFLFSGTIKSNVLYGKPTASDDEVIESLKRSNAWQFVKDLPDTIDSSVGAKGTQLSGGQRQRVAIARAFLRNPDILLLDEATSALDNESEKLVQSALESLMKDRTTIMIAHRLSTVRNCDQIVVIESGAVIEQGTHDQLMEKNGMYANLVRVGEKH
jgi:ATP-binding cassette subfamily B (MDR/TAP) protein 1